MLTPRDLLPGVAGVLFLLGAPLADAAEKNFTLNGRVRPLTQGITVGLHAMHTTAPFRVQKPADSKGRFKFGKLKPGTYMVIASHPRWGEIRQTVEVGSSFADEKGRVEVTLLRGRNETLDYSRTPDSIVIPVQELTIPDKARAQFRKADNKLRKNKIEEAIEHLEKAVEIAPQFGDAWNQLGIIAHRHRRFDQAEGHFRRAADLDAGAFEPAVNLGAALLALGRTEEALDYTRRAHEMRPDDPLANAQLGSIFLHMGDDEAALRYLKRSKEIDPGHYGYPQLELARIYVRRGEPQKAIEELEDFEARHPGSPLAEVNLKALSQLRDAVREADAEPVESGAETMLTRAEGCQ